MKKKNKDLIPLLVIGAGGLYLLASGKKGGKSSSLAPEVPGGGIAPSTAAPPVPGSGTGSGSDARYVKLERMGYSPRTNFRAAVSAFQKDYNEWKGQTAIAEDGEWGPETEGALDEAISVFGDSTNWGGSGTSPGASSSSQGTTSGPAALTSDVDYSAFWGRHDHAAGFYPDDTNRLVTPPTQRVPGWKDGLSAADIINLVNRWKSGALREEASGEWAYPLQAHVGTVHTGPRNQISGSRPTLDHYHISNVRVSDIKSLAEGGVVELNSSVGFEVAPNTGTESHMHTLTLRLI